MPDHRFEAGALRLGRGSLVARARTGKGGTENLALQDQDALRSRLREMDGADAESINALLDAVVSKPGSFVERGKLAIEQGLLPRDLAQSFVRRLSPENRQALLKSLNPGARQNVTGAGKPESLLTEKSLQFDWSRFRDPGSSYCPMTAWGMATLACLVYEKLGKSGTDAAAAGPLFAPLVQGGFEVVFVGDERDAKGQPRIACPMLVAFRDDVAIVAVRGSQSDRSWDHDWNTKLTSGHGGQLHAGVDDAGREMWSELAPVLDAQIAKLPAGKKLRVYLTGHSLGGLVAVLLGHELVGKPRAQVESAYVFGVPKAFDPAVAAELEQSGIGTRTWRFENHRDLAVRLPENCPMPQVRRLHGKFVHVGSAIYCDPHGQLHSNLEERAIRQREKMPDLAAEGLAPAHSMFVYARKLYLNRDGHA